ncbi:hypothetical protein JTE90_019228 [Oedothorax gibbosus]|uniref:G-patch domain-containing protein n=1 Tax=Oedothorax gibbosus TaxID=931172 RepID=A0AAV6UTF9_9ARAC|nr:hypothetical protein JTE90_019228 [Oedothorax gibbosus]
MISTIILRLTMCATVKTFSIGHFDLNPRGNLWANDEGGVGRRLLQRMGWREGRGLGRGEDGPTSPLRPTIVRGNAGLGFTEKLPFVKESHAYDSVLENLNKKFQTNRESKQTEERGLEQRSQQFKKRLHYRKFVRGKDVGRYSPRDMAAIFATRPHDPPADAPTREEECQSTFRSPLSMEEYFARKMQKKSGEDGEIKKSVLEEDGEDGEAVLEEDAPSKMPSNEEGCLSLPPGRRYDAWLESQRAAARMKVYRAMVRRLCTHPVLRTTNLARLKGYGNWG